MDDETTRVAVGLRFGTPLCPPMVDDLAIHGLSCCFSEGQHPLHATVNCIIQRVLTSAKVPSRLELTGLYKSDGKRPDGCMILPWKSGKMLVWDATCPDTYAPSHLSAAATEAGAVAVQAEQLKNAKYAHPASSHHFVPFAMKTSGVMGQAALGLLCDLGQRLHRATGEPRRREYLLQRLSVAIQRGTQWRCWELLGGGERDPFWK